MRQVRQFLRLSGPDRLLLLEAALLVGAARAGLWLLPFRRIHGLPALARRWPAHRPGRDHALVRGPWAVRLAAAYVPAASCLTQALAAQALLARRGLATELCIGVARGASGVEAHAWLVRDGRIVIGELPDMLRFTPLPAFERSTT